MSRGDGMGDLVVHIGQAKASSTSVQRALAANRSRLVESGVNYPGSERDDHAADAARFIVDHDSLRSGPRPALARHIRRLAEVGDWDALVQSVARHPLTIISSEIFARFDRTLAEAAVDSLVGNSTGDVRIVIIARPASKLLPSLYAQTALDWALPTFETWVRMTLRNLLSTPLDAATPDRSAIDACWLRATWRGAAPVTVVDLDPPAGSTFDRSVIDALKLTGVVSPPFLEHTNRSPCAARLIAWQQVVRRDGRPDKPDHFGTRPPFEPFADSQLPGAGGRFRLTEPAARVVDVAFPRPSETQHLDSREKSLAARDDVDRMIMSRDPLTYVAGVEGEQLAHAVDFCLARLPFQPQRNQRMNP